MEWICPVCGKALRPDAGSYRCENRHCFDRAKSGYVNLLPPSVTAMTGAWCRRGRSFSHADTMRI